PWTRAVGPLALLDAGPVRARDVVGDPELAVMPIHPGRHLLPFRFGFHHRLLSIEVHHHSPSTRVALGDSRPPGRPSRRAGADPASGPHAVEATTRSDSRGRRP